MSGLTGVMTKEQLAGLQAGIPVGDYSRIEQAIASVASNPPLKSYTVINVKTDFGAKGDSQVVSDGAMNGTTAVLTSASNKFAAGDVGKSIAVPGAGAAGALLATTIASYQNAGQVTLAAVSATAVAGAMVTWGTDDTTVITSAINSLPANGGTVFFPPGIYWISASLPIKANAVYLGTGTAVTATTGNPTAPNPSSYLNGPTMTTPIFDVTAAGNLYSPAWQWLGFGGNASSSGSKGIHSGPATNLIQPTLRDCFFDSFGSQALHFETGVGGYFHNLFAQNGLKVRTGRVAIIGVFDIALTDIYMYGCFATASIIVSEGAGSGFLAGIAIRGANSFIESSAGELSQTGIYVSGAAGNVWSRFSACRAQLNYGPGWQVDGSSNVFMGCFAERNSQATDNTYSGFVVTGNDNQFIGNVIEGLAGDTLQQKNGFDDSCASGPANAYVQNRANVIRGVLLNSTGAVKATQANLVNGGAWRVDAPTGYTGNLLEARLNAAMVASVDQLGNTAGRLLDWGGGFYNVKSPLNPSGAAKGDGATDDTVSIQAAITAAAAAVGGANGGIVYFPTGRYRVSASLVPANGVRLVGAHGYTDANPPAPGAYLWSLAGFNSPIISGGSGLRGVGIEDLGLFGTSSSGSTGISATTAFAWNLKNLFLANFGDQAINLVGGGENSLDNIWVQQALLVRTGRAALVGCVDVGSADSFLTRITATASVVTGDGTGNICGIVMRGSNSFMSNCIGHISQIGIAVPSATQFVHMVACRADLNNGQGFQIDGFQNDLVMCTAFRNSQSGDNASSGFLVTNIWNTLVACKVDGISGDAIQQKNGFEDSAASGTGNARGNMYVGCRAPVIRGTLYKVTGTTIPTITDPASIVLALTYSATIATDASQGEYFTIAATNGTAYTISNPTNVWVGKEIEYEILNSSGGAMGAITWGGNFLLAGAFVNPANTKRRTIRFRNNGTNLVEVTRAAADI